MKHTLIDGTIYHKRFLPKTHEFFYPFFMLNIHTGHIEDLKNSLFSINKFNLFSFYTKDHFGQSECFEENIDTLLKKFLIDSSHTIRFVTLPRIMGFVFNPISVLILLKENKPDYILAEVHNYNGGRIIYPVKLEETTEDKFQGQTKKDMHVSPFLDRVGLYKFILKYTQNEFVLNVTLYENNKKTLTSIFEGKYQEYNKQNILKLFFKHTFLTMWVVTRTLFQTIKLKLKGLKWYQAQKIDQERRF